VVFAGKEVAPSTLAFVMCIFVTFIEMVGPQFCGPVLTPYGTSMSLSKFEIGTLFTSSAVGAIISSFLLPAFSDKKGRKLAIILSAIGIGAAHFLQGIAFVWEFPVSYAALLLGRGFAGLFGGVGTVLSAYLTEISNSDYDLLKRRMTLMSGAQQVAGLVLGPLAGFIATLGLYIPFLVASAAALVGTPVLMAFMRNPDVVLAQEAQARKALLSTAKAAQAPAKAQAPAAGPRNRFWQDPVMTLYMLCYVCLGFLGVAITPLLTFLIQYPSYGLLRDDPTQTQGVVAQATSILMFPQKLLELTTMLLVYPMVSKRMNDKKCGIIGAVVLTLGTLGLALLAWNGDSGASQEEDIMEIFTNVSSDTMLVSFAGDSRPSAQGGFQGRLWMVAVCMAFHGFGDGMLIPVLLGSAPKYRGVMYPDRLGDAGAFVSRGIFFGLMLGVPISLKIADTHSLGMAWLLLLIVGVLFYVLFVVADKLGQAKMAARQAAAPPAGQGAASASHSLVLPGYNSDVLPPGLSEVQLTSGTFQT